VITGKAFYDPEKANASYLEKFSMGRGEKTVRLSSFLPGPGQLAAPGLSMLMNVCKASFSYCARCKNLVQLEAIYKRKTYWSNR